MHSKATVNHRNTDKLSCYFPTKILVFTWHAYIVFAEKVTTYKGRFLKAVTPNALSLQKSQEVKWYQKLNRYKLSGQWQGRQSMIPSEEYIAMN